MVGPDIQAEGADCGSESLHLLWVLTDKQIDMDQNSAKFHSGL